jgi:RecA/RadA recombinase
MTKKNMSRLLKHTGAVTEYVNPHLNVIQSPSPSLNFVYGNGWGLPFGHTVVMYGPAKAGKTLIVNSMVGQLHQDDPDAVVIKYDTEFREKTQNGPAQQKIWGIDRDRYVCYEVNEPGNIFDHIAKDVAAEIDDGLPVKMIIIDSLSFIQGRRAMNADSVMQQQIGDNALTIQDGLRMILPVIKRRNIALVLTAQVRAEMDMVEQMRGKKYKMQASWAVKHAAEYFLLIEPDLTKAGRVSLDGKEFIDDSHRDLRDKGEQTGHKIKVKMEDSSAGPKGRVGVFTIDYNRGIINTHEEVFLLGVARGVIEQPNQMSYVFGPDKWVGKQNVLAAIRDSKDLQQAILKEIKVREMQGRFKEVSEESSPTEESSG